MTISGFSFVRNGSKLYFPVRESIESILPICDEFLIALGKGDPDDRTREEIESINSPKIKIMETVWYEKHYKGGAIYAIQTDIAKQHCTGDWLFYIQADEAVHEKYLPIIKGRCEELLDDKEVEGLIFKYRHFWGDYEHYHAGHGWYPNEIRIIRNLPEIHSWQDAQSFRRYDYYESPHQVDGTHKLKVARVEAEIFHYGWVRPPYLMQNKRKDLFFFYKNKNEAEEMTSKFEKEFDYGPLDRLAVFNETHPKVMLDRIARMDWKDKLQYTGKPYPLRQPHKHELVKYRIISWFEKHFNHGEQIGAFKNFKLLKK
jgi:hypothetical protein